MARWFWLSLACSGDETKTFTGDTFTDAETGTDTQPPTEDTDTNTTVENSALTGDWLGICPATFTGPTTANATGVEVDVYLVEREGGAVTGSGALEFQFIDYRYNLELPALVGGTLTGDALEFELLFTETTLGPDFHGIMAGTLAGDQITGEWRFYHYGIDGDYDAWPCTLDRQ